MHEGMGGFATLKDVLDVIVVPLALVLLGALLPVLFDWRRRRVFKRLILRELVEAEPKMPGRKKPVGWTRYLDRRFIHEDIFRQPSENRDFILSLQPNLVYNLAQMWAQFDKAEATEEPDEAARHGARWCDYLRGVCEELDGNGSAGLRKNVLAPWESVMKGDEPKT